MTEQVASHSDNVQQEQGPSQEVVDTILREQFGIDTSKKEEPSEDKIDASNDEQEAEEDEKESPAIEEPKVFRKLKHNKKEVEVTEDQVDELLQKGLALDKERERKTEYEKHLDRVAKLQGFKDHADLIANLDKLEKESQKKREDQFEDVKKQLREEAENAGMDPDKVEEWLENNPLLVQAKQILERDKMTAQERQLREAQEQATQAWSKLFDKYPQLAENVSEDGTEAPWMTEEFTSRINRGYDPLDAYEIVFKDEIQANERKRMEQEVIKQQRLNKRAKVEGTAPADQEDDDPNLERVKGAFAAFGLDPKKAKQFMTKK